jgi:hypothetical protein
MINISWLESIALMTDHDHQINDILLKQSDEIQKAYQSNDQSELKVLLGGSERLACKKTIFQLSSD